MEEFMIIDTSVPSKYIPGVQKALKTAPRTNFSHQALKVNARQCRMQPQCKLYKEEVEANLDLCRNGGLRPRGQEHKHPTLTLFRNVNNHAAGDYIMMSKNDWMETGAFPEFASNKGGKGMDDWLICRLLHVFKKAQLTLNDPCYIVHQFHGGKA